MIAALAIATLFAAAEPDAATRAQQAMEEGIRAQKQNDIVRALELYELARKLVPDASLPHRYAAEALRKLGRFKESIEAYEQYLFYKPNALDAADVREVIARIRRERLESRVDVLCTPVGAELFVDLEIEPRAKTPALAVRLSAGKHVLTVRAPGHHDHVRSAEIAAGPSEIVCKLQPIEAMRIVPPAEAAVVVVEVDPPAWWESPWTWIGAGVIVVGASVAAAVAIDAGTELPQTRGGVHAFR